jgi:uncharacterized protein YeaO (DUF488 family)
MAQHDIRLRRVYDENGRSEEGHRVLVDRLWPRGISKAEAAFDEWLEDAAPSTELRRWYSHDVAKYEEFARRYRLELRGPVASAAMQRLIELARSQTVTLLTAARDVDHSAAWVLRDRLTSRAHRSRRKRPG